MAIMLCKKNKDSMSVTFGPDTSIYNAAKIKSGLITIISMPVNNYRLDLSKITDTDVSFIQLLISFSKRLKKENKKLSLVNLSRNSEFMYTASSCGINVHELFEFEDG